MIDAKQRDNIERNIKCGYKASYGNLPVVQAISDNTLVLLALLDKK